MEWNAYLLIKDVVLSSPLYFPRLCISVGLVLYFSSDPVPEPILWPLTFVQGLDSFYVLEDLLVTLWHKCLCAHNYFNLCYTLKSRRAG